MSGASGERVLVVDDDETLRRTTGALLRQAGWQVEVAADGEEALGFVAGFEPSVMLLDLRMPGVNGLEVLDRSLVLAPEVAVVICTAHGSIDAALDSMRRGAFDFLTKPFTREQLNAAVEKGLRHHRLLRENRSLRAQVERSVGPDGPVAVSRAMVELMSAVSRVAATPSTVLLTGETGVGKEVVARALHAWSGRAPAPFHAVNLAAIPAELFESELFGHARGAFTGAVADRPGAFETADTGTLFLDEVAELPQFAQAKLLRALQEREFRRVGEARTRSLGARVVAATNRDLQAEVRAGHFREDLFYRLNVVPMTIPPLRSRREDIPALAARFLRSSARRLEREQPRLSADALEALEAYSWPGNVRELENLMERAVALAAGDVLNSSDLGLEQRREDLAAMILDARPAGLDLSRLEAELIEATLDRCGGNRSEAARRLGVTRSALLYRLSKYGLDA